MNVIQQLLKKIYIFKNKIYIKNVADNLPAKKKLVYFIACHKNPNQVIRLIKAIYHPDNLYFINIDKKSSTEFYKVITSSFFSKYKNIYILKNKIDWGKWNQVQVTLDIIEKALSLNKEWTHFINISGQDFPLKNQEEIQNILSNQLNKSFIEARRYYHKEVESERLFSFRPQGYEGEQPLRLDLMNPSINFYKGSQWMILSKSFCEYVSKGEMSKKLKPLFRYAFIPDESFFPTLAANSELSSSIIWNNKRFIDWSKGGSHPENLNINYLEKIIASPAFFARKFDDKIDSEIISKLESRLNN